MKLAPEHLAQGLDYFMGTYLEMVPVPAHRSHWPPS